MGNGHYHPKGLTKWIWKCPHAGCNGHGKTPLSRFKAGRYARQHMGRVHPGSNKEPILIEVTED